MAAGFAPSYVLRMSLHPEGIAPRIANLGDWKAHLLARLRRQIEVCGDSTLIELKKESEAYPAPAAVDGADSGFVVPLELKTPAGVLRFISTTTVFRHAGRGDALRAGGRSVFSGGYRDCFRAGTLRASMTSGAASATLGTDPRTRECPRTSTSPCSPPPRLTACLRQYSSAPR